MTGTVWELRGRADLGSLSFDVRLHGVPTFARFLGEPRIPYR